MNKEAIKITIYWTVFPFFTFFLYKTWESLTLMHEFSWMSEAISKPVYSFLGLSLYAVMFPFLLIPLMISIFVTTNLYSNNVSIKSLICMFVPIGLAILTLPGLILIALIGTFAGMGAGSAGFGALVIYVTPLLFFITSVILLLHFLFLHRYRLSKATEVHEYYFVRICLLSLFLSFCFWIINFYSPIAQEYALLNNSPAACNLIATEIRLPLGSDLSSSRGACIQLVGVKHSNAQACDSFIERDVFRKNECYQDLAVSLKNASICEAIEVSERPVVEYDNIGWKIPSTNYSRMYIYCIALGQPYDSDSEGLNKCWDETTEQDKKNCFKEALPNAIEEAELLKKERKLLEQKEAELREKEKEITKQKELEANSKKLFSDPAPPGGATTTVGTEEKPRKVKVGDSFMGGVIIDMKSGN